MLGQRLVGLVVQNFSQVLYLSLSKVSSISRCEVDKSAASVTTSGRFLMPSNFSFFLPSSQASWEGVSSLGCLIWSGLSLVEFYPIAFGSCLATVGLSRP